MEEIKYESRVSESDLSDAMVKLNDARVILEKLINDYGFGEKVAPSYQGVYHWFTNNGERTQQEKNSVKWVEDYEYISTMIHLIDNFVYDSHKALVACNE
jgi:hypothetical protein